MGVLLRERALCSQIPVLLFLPFVMHHFQASCLLPSSQASILASFGDMVEKRIGVNGEGIESSGGSLYSISCF